MLVSLDLELYLQLLNNNDNYTTLTYAALKMHLFNRILIVLLVSLNQCFHLRQQAHGAHLRNQRKRLTNRRPLFLIPGYSRRKLNVRIVFPRSHYELNSHRRNLAAGSSVGANTRLYHARKIAHPYANDKVIPSTEYPVLSNDLKILSTYRGRSGDHSKQLVKPVRSSTVSISYLSLMRVSDSVESYSNRRMPSFTREPVTHLKDFIEKVKTTPNPATLSPFYTTSVLYKISSLPLEVMGNNHQKIENNKTVEETGLIVANVVKGSLNGSLKLQTVREQLNAVLLISNETLRRELMKDLVKRIVSGSGLLSRNSSKVDIATLDNILEMVKNISNRLNASSDMDSAVKQILKDNAIVMENKTVTLQETSTILNNKGIPIDNKGKTHLWHMESQETNVKLPDIATKKSLISSTDILREFKQKGRHTLKHLAGKSIYGNILPTSKSVDTPLDFRMSQQDHSVGSSIIDGGQKVKIDVTNSHTTTFSPLTTLVGSGDINPDVSDVQTASFSPLPTTEFDFSNDTGNSLEYWGHLTAGLANMLCSFCTQRGFQRCMDRHCNDASLSRRTAAPNVT